MLGVVEEPLDGRVLDPPARVHHEDAVGQPRDDPEVVRDEDDCGPQPLADVAQHVEDDRLGRHIEGGRRLVRYEHLRVAGEGHRDQHALLHPARELVRVVVDALLGALDANGAQELDGAFARRRPGDAEVALERLSDLAAHSKRRVERDHRLLEDVGQLAAPHSTQSSW